MADTNDGRGRKSAVTLADVAGHAGVSRATASLVLRETGRVSVATRERVHASMSALGYIPDKTAAALRHHSTNTVGVVVTNLANPFFGELLRGFERTMSDANHTCLLTDTGDDPQAQKATIQELRSHRVAGLAIIPATGTSTDPLRELQDAALPFVLMSRNVHGAEFPFVGADDELGGELVARHMIEVHGCRALAYIGGQRPILSRQARIAGVKRAMAANGLPPESLLDAASPTTGAGGLDAAHTLLASGRTPDAILCHSDGVAFGVYRALRQRGLANDIPVTGFDDVSTAALWEPPLTSVATRGERLGRIAAERLLEAIAGSSRTHVDRFPPSLVVRESCGCPAERGDFAP